MNLRVVDLLHKGRISRVAIDDSGYEFYLRLGFTIVGVMPDANGPGKPDIFLAKRVSQTAPQGPRRRRS